MSSSIMRFTIPLQRDDLRKPAENSWDYRVRCVYTIRDLKTKLNECEAAVKQFGAGFLLGDGDCDGFDVCFSVMIHFHKQDLSAAAKMASQHLLEKALCDLVQGLDTFLEQQDSSPAPTADKTKWLTKTKMLSYLFCQTLEMAEAAETAGTTDSLAVGRRKGASKKKSSSTSESNIYELEDDDTNKNGIDRKITAVTLLYRLLNLNISALFDPPIVDEELVNVIASCLFRMLESPTISLVKGKDLKTSIFQALGVLNCRYGYSLSCRLKIVQSLRHFEHLAQPLAEGVALFAREYNSSSMVMEIIRDLSQISPAELTRDASATRAYAAFLIELAGRVPDLVRHCLSLLMVHLDGESYSLRKCVLSIFCEIILKTLIPAPAPEQPDASQPGIAGVEAEVRQPSIVFNAAANADKALMKDTRDQLLDCLEDHVHDAHAFVRSSVLQVWGRLCIAKAIPLSRQERLLRLVIGRLQDKSSNVRKQSVLLLTSLLQCNPYTATMPVEEFKEQLKEAEVKLTEMTERVKGKEEKREAEWELFRSGELAKALEKWNADMNEDIAAKAGERKSNGSTKPIGHGKAEYLHLEPVWDNATRDEVYSRLQHLMQKNHAKKALSLLKNAQDRFPDDGLFNALALVTDSANADGVSVPDENDKIEVVLKTIFLTDLHFNRLDHDNVEEEIRKQETVVNYFKDCVAFGEELNKALPTVCLLLGSKQVSDVLEAINFFVSAFEFGVLNAMMGVRKMLTLIFSREQEIKKAVVSAYKRLYIDQTSPRQIVRNLIALIEGASVGEVASLEELVIMLVDSKDIGKECFQLMWQYFTFAGASTTKEEARAAVIMLGMVANKEPTIITSNLCLLVNNGLTQAAKIKYSSEAFEKEGQGTNFRLVHDTCVALSKVANIKQAKEEQQPFRLEAGHDIFVNLEKILTRGIWNFSDPFFIPMSQKALMVVYLLSEQPDMLAGRVIKTICSVIEKKDSFPKIDRRVIQRLISLIGHISLCQLNHLDVSILNEMKRRKTIRETSAEDKLKSCKRTDDSNKKRQSKTTIAVDDGDDDLEIVGAEADDTEFEFIRNVCESEVVTSPDSLISLFLPLIQDICANPTKYPDPDLRSAASLALAKVMLISSMCCEEYLQLLFTVMEKSPEPVIRANLVVAAGDLSFRFPNTMEPWTPHMYKMLRDTSSHVRSNTLTVLTHLVLNDMIKVKGQISDIAFCIADTIDRIAGLAKHFFSELSHKGNALYNVMPDIISRLSTSSSEGNGDSVPVSEDTFREIMSYIMGLIEKDKHLESLVEKLCQRFRVTNCERQWRDLAFCLSLFKYSDRTIKKLAENFLCFSDKLHEEEVNNAFLGILVHSRKLVKQDSKLVIDELEDKMSKARDKCLEDNSTSKRALAAKISKKGLTSATITRKRKKAYSDKAEDDQDFD